MRQALATLLTLLFIASCPMAANAAQCAIHGTMDAKELTFDLTDKEVVRGLRASFYLGIKSPDLPAKLVSESKAPCSLGTFEEGGGKFELFAQDNALPFRWAASAGQPQFIIYLALMPRPDDARKWEDAGSKLDENGAMNFSSPPMWTLVLTTGDEHRRVYNFFDAIPDDARLKALMQTIAHDQFHWLIAYDQKTNEATVNPKP